MAIRTPQERETEALITAMPKAELHLHLDGCLRPGTTAELAEMQGIDLGVPRDRVRDLLEAPASCTSLVELLGYFAIPIRVLQTVEALERVTYELCEDVARENVRYVEIRFAPSLHTEAGLSLDAVIQAVVRGWDAGRRALGLAGGVILCAMRHLSPGETRRVAVAGLPYLGRGVIGFDLAGDEAGYSVVLHREPLVWARDAGYNLTIHAGEAAGPQSVRDAVEIVGAQRIGHGTHSGEDASLLPVLRDRHITLEMCPSSNLQTRAVSSVAMHPLARYYRARIPVTVNTDNRTVSQTSMTRELSIGTQLGLNVKDLAQMTLGAIEAGFGEPGARQEMARAYRTELASLGIL